MQRFNPGTIPGGAGLTGHILIQIVDANGVWRDVTTEILSMGVTVGEPNAIVQLQRPLWAAFTQGSRDASGGAKSSSIDGNSSDNTKTAADGADRHISFSFKLQRKNATYGYLQGIIDDAQGQHLAD